jgi:antitoxin (DNA-binding transcriptional repressor) of toxin-antitoxin stability system
MRTVTVRDLRLHWPRIEKLLRAAGTPLTVTRDGVPVAEIGLPSRDSAPRKRFDGDAHMRWLREFWRNEPPGTSSEEMIRRQRADRRF